MKITLIGAGNVGYHLGRKLYACGIEIGQVFSRNALKAKELADLVQATFTDNLDQISPTADLYLLAVHDDAIRNVALQLAANGLSEKRFAHTSGATPMSVFSGVQNPQKADATNPLIPTRYGIFYPLQTFSRQREPDFSQIPFCIDANNEQDREWLMSLARRLSPKVFHIDDAQRAELHVAAVFVNNFVNHLFYAGHEILDRKKLPFDLLLPLIRETVNKLDNGTSFNMQTGPARRNDQATIQRHMALLQDQPRFRHLYEILTESIHQTYHPDA